MRYEPPVCLPKQHINLYRYREDGQAVFEVAIPENIAERAGLV